MKFSDLKRNDIWQKGHNILPQITIENNSMNVTNIRNMNYKTGEEGYFDASYDLNTLQQVNLISVPFGFRKLISHLMLEYVFEDSESIVLSIEARRKQGEKFSPLKGFFRHYGLIYIWGTYKDLVGLRKDIRKDMVYTYPLLLDKDQMQRSLIFFTQKTNELLSEPRYYHTFFSNCSSNLWDVFSIRSSGLPKKSHHLILNANIHKYLEELGYIDKKILGKD